MSKLPVVAGLFALSFLLAGGVLLGRRLARSARERAWKRSPGRAPQNPWHVSRFDEIEDVLHGVRCHCGGTLVPLSEGSIVGADGTLRVAHAECLRCEADHYLYFDVSEVRH